MGAGCRVGRAAALAALCASSARCVHTTLASTCSYELVVKKSRFVALAAPVGSAEEAVQWVRESADGAARHNAFAYRLVDGSTRSNGDGEPGGTAGPPIAAAIAGADLYGVAVLVRRYRLDGGAKLGTGGLVRAYGGAAAGVLERAERREVVPLERLALHFDAADTGTVYRIMGEYDCLAPAEPSGKGAGTPMRTVFGVPAEEAEGVRRQLQQATQGRIFLEALTPDAGDANSTESEAASEVESHVDGALDDAPLRGTGVAGMALDSVEGLASLMDGMPSTVQLHALDWCRQAEAGSVSLIVLAGMEADFVAALPHASVDDEEELLKRLERVADEVAGGSG